MSTSLNFFYLTGAENFVGDAVPFRQLRPPPLSDDLHAHRLGLDGGDLADVPVADNPESRAGHLRHTEKKKNRDRM